ncbi:Trp biosynthesis-associated membrane protein [Knoellia subterranea]|uniref:Trp biosynthesis-associated membrane protein n=1 Tax=Knoellia subterranea TaxID=184882 RepID=UPI0006891E57|nr:Trp biosynthesis-associated membrane protein [Knoellia subterranea]
MSVLRRRGVLVLITVLGAFLVVVTASRTWVTGSVDDVVLGATSVSATGAEAASGVVALALVVLAGAIASATAGPRARIVALVLTALAVLAGLASVGRVLLDPDGVLGPIAAAAAGRTGSLETHSNANGWPWAAAVGFALAGAALAGLVRTPKATPGLSSRYEVPGRVATSDWDQLTAGDDPTDVGPEPRT